MIPETRTGKDNERPTPVGKIFSSISFITPEQATWTCRDLDLIILYPSLVEFVAILQVAPLYFGVHRRRDRKVMHRAIVIGSNLARSCSSYCRISPEESLCRQTMQCLQFSRTQRTISFVGTRPKYSSAI